MGLRAWLTEPHLPAIETAPPPLRVITEATEPDEPFVVRKGYETGIPRGGTEATHRLSGDGRAQKLQTLRDVFKACPWVSIPINVIARTMTAGGVVIVPDADTPEGKSPTPPPAVERLSRLVRRVNPREDMRQLLRSTAQDMLWADSGWIEVTWLSGEPVALWTLDATTMSVDADEHGMVKGYVQRLPDRREPVLFDPHEVIQITLDSVDGGVYGQSPTDTLMTEIDTWLFAAASLKEMARKGFPPRLHVDQPASMPKKEEENWLKHYLSRVLKALNIGTPVMTKGGATVTELTSVSPVDVMKVKDSCRDTIIAGYGVPPRKCGVKTPGQLGGAGEAESENKTLKYNTVGPIAGLLLEKINYAITQVGFGIQGWHIDLPEVDWQDSEIAEKIRDTRLRNGAWVLNRYRQDIGEPPVEGGDDPVIIDRGNIVFWSDIARYTAAEIAKLEGAAEPAAPDAPPAAVPPVPDDDDEPPLSKPGKAGKGPKEEADRRMRLLTESYLRARKRALRELPSEVTV